LRVLGTAAGAVGVVYHAVILHGKTTTSWWPPGDTREYQEDGIDVWPLDRFAAAVADRSLWP
jgi:hypothetical protein